MYNRFYELKNIDINWFLKKTILNFYMQDIKHFQRNLKQNAH